MNFNLASVGKTLTNGLSNITSTGYSKAKEGWDFITSFSNPFESLGSWFSSTYSSLKGRASQITSSIKLPNLSGLNLFGIFKKEETKKPDLKAEIEAYVSNPDHANQLYGKIFEMFQAKLDPSDLQAGENYYKTHGAQHEDIQAAYKALKA